MDSNITTKDDDGNGNDGIRQRRIIQPNSRENWNLMAQSREQLTMDMNKSENSIFKRPSGCYISRAKGIFLLLVLVVATVAAGLIAYHIGQNAALNNPQVTSGIDSSDSGETSGSRKPKDVRLPTNIRPLYYKVDLIPYVDPLKNFTIDGKVKIDILCLEETNKVTLHIKNITIQESKVSIIPKYQNVAGEENSNDSESESTLNSSAINVIQIVKHEYDVPREFYNITIKESLKLGKVYQLYIEFTAILSDELAGFYRSSYKDKATNETRWLGVTQFQPTDARRAFPCFDEPHLKADFEVSLARIKNMSSISNMNLLRTEDIPEMPGWVWDHYNRSVPMSTYLVAFVVSDFEHLTSNVSLSKPEFRVWARKDAINQAEYAREIGPRILSYFEEYFNISFPLPKQDMIALPDFGAGAMENWGLITYRETAMLYDPKVSSDINKQRAAFVISHELAHQWFGNLVTPSWWSDLWLNEGFASYVEYTGVDHVSPDWKVMEKFVADEIHDVFGLDALDSSHPISVPVHHPDEINEIFDSISYAKGASIIRMMNHFLTQSTFNKGLTNYLNKWKYNNTEQGNLWEALTDQAHLDKTLDVHIRVGEIMDTWTLQKGFPVINVTRNYVHRSANFTQMKFQLIKNESFAAEYEKYKWWVPISYSTNNFNADFSKTQPEFWLEKKDKSLNHDIHANKSEWLVLNPQETGYYRVNYDERNWRLLIDQLNENRTAIHTVNRAQLLDDALNLARASLLRYDLAFNVTKFLKDDNEYLPWEAFLVNFQYISAMLQRTGSFGIFRKYMRELIEDQYKLVGFDQSENDPLLTKFHRINILSTACSVGHEGCISSSRKLFADWMNKTDPNGDNPIPTNLRRTIYCNGIRHGGEKEWDFAWKRYLESNVATEKAIILLALSCTRETWILNRYLHWSIKLDSGIRKQDSRSVMSGIANNEVGNFLAFNFVREKWSTIRKYFGTGFSLGGVIKTIAGKFNTPYDLEELKFFKQRNEHELASAARAVDQAIEGTRANIAWMQANFKDITQWLEERTSDELDTE